MDLDDPHTLELFLSVYGTLPRAGPGGDEHTLRALDMVPGPPPRTVLDLGCGPGAQTLALARALPEAEILAVDLLPTMVERANRRFREARLGDRVRAEVGDMAAPPIIAATTDLIWCEGAIYFLGVTDALEIWHPLLAPGGSIAFTEAVWLTPDPPDEVRRWWQSQYPAITDEHGVRAAIGAASCRTIGSFTLPASAWRDQYYRPMEPRIAELRARHPNDPSAIEVAANAEREIDCFRRFSECYSYAFFVVQPEP
jgi:trans-aconitate methyltransferase